MNELKSYTEYAVSTPTADFVIGFDFNYGEDAVNVTVDDVPATEAGYTVVYLNETTIRLSPSVPSGVVRLQRETDIDQTDHAYRAGAKFIAQTMDENFEQLRHSQQEVRDGFSKLSSDTHEIIEGLDVALELAQDAAQDAQDAAVIAQGAADTVNTIIVEGKVAAGNVLDVSGETQQQVNYNGGSKWYSRVGGYQENERVVLANGDVVKSTVDGNSNDPNVNMTGWVKVNAASQILYANGYTVQASLYYLTPEMFGAVGDGVTDDYQSIQTMLNVGAAGCTFEFDGSKTYYNAFVIDSHAVFVDHKNGASNSKQWTRSLGATFKFNGARLTRRAPTGDIEDIPYKTKYSDNDSSSLLIKDATKIIICDPYIDCGGDKRGFVDVNSDLIADSTDYYGADVGVYGLRLRNCSDIEFRNVHAEKGYFNVFLDSCTDVKGDITSKYAVQCPIRSYAPTDLNFGGAIKVWFCTDVDLHIRGAYNANATAEVEKGNYNVRITGSSKNDWSNSVVIQDTQVVTIDWSAEDVKSGTGVFIKRTGEAATPNLNNIKGRIHAKNCYWRGVMIENASGTVGDLYGVQLDIVTENCGDGGLYIRNDSETSVIDGISINHFSKDDDGTNKARCLVGRMRGTISGNQTGTDYGVIVQGTNTASTCITLSIDASNCTVPYDVASTAFVNFKEFVTSTDVITAFAGKNMQLGTTTNKGNYVNQGEIRLNHFAVKVSAQYNVFQNLAGSSGNERLRMWYDSAAGVPVTGGINYPLKVFIPTP